MKNSVYSRNADEQSSALNSFLFGQHLLLKFLLFLVVFGGMWQGAEAQIVLQDTSDVIWSKQINPSGVFDLKLSPDNKIIAASTVEDVTGRLKIIILETAGGKLIKEFYDGTGSLSFSPDGKYLASGCSDTSIRIWNIQTGLTENILFKNYPDKKYLGLGGYYSQDGRYFIALCRKQSKYLGGGKWISPADIFVWRTDLWEIIYHTDDDIERSGLAISPKNDYFATFPVSFSDFDITLYKMVDFKPIVKLSGHIGTINSIAFSNDGKYLASASQDNTIKVWDNLSSKLINTFNPEFEPMSIRFSPNSKYLISGSGGKIIEPITQVYEFENFHKIYSYQAYGTLIETTNNSEKILLNIFAGKNLPPYNISLVKAHWEPNAINDDGLQHYDIKIYPNPTNNKMFFEIMSKSNMYSSIIIKDINGNTIQDIFSGALSEGKNEFIWEINDVASGLYLCEFRTTLFTKTFKINVNK